MWRYVGATFASRENGRGLVQTRFSSVTDRRVLSLAEITRASQELLSMCGLGRRPGRGGLWRAVSLGHVTQVDADAVPDGGAAAHPVDEDVVFGEVRCGFGVGGFPAGQSLQSKSLVRRVGEGEQWVFGDASGGGFARRLWCGSLQRLRGETWGASRAARRRGRRAAAARSRPRR